MKDIVDKMGFNITPQKTGSKLAVSLLAERLLTVRRGQSIFK